MWSAGATIYYLFEGKRVSDMVTGSDLEYSQVIATGGGGLSHSEKKHFDLPFTRDIESFQPELKETVFGLLMNDPAARWSAAQAIDGDLLKEAPTIVSQPPDLADMVLVDDSSVREDVEYINNAEDFRRHKHLVLRDER